MKKALIIGASSGIGRELAIILAKNGFEVGLMARRMELLKALQNEIPTKCHVGHLDLSKSSEAIEKVQEMLRSMNGIDLVVINSGTGFLNTELEWSKELETIEVNVSGFCAIAGVVYKSFAKQGKGHLVGISSIGALRGNHIAPAYNASKAFMSNYLEGLRKKAIKDNIAITVTEIQPGAVKTDMLQGIDFWVASPQKAADQIYSAIQTQQTHAYVTKRWRLIGWLLKCMPDSLYLKRL